MAHERTGAEVRGFVSVEELTFWRDILGASAQFTAESFDLSPMTVKRAWLRHPERHPEAGSMESKEMKS